MISALSLSDANYTNMRSKLFTVLFAFFVMFLIQRSNAQEDSGHFYISFDKTKIYYEVQGSGYPVILVHGFIVDGKSWKKTVLYTDLIREGYKVIRLDMRGNGRSDKPHTAEAYANDAEAKDIMGLAS